MRSGNRRERERGELEPLPPERRTGKREGSQGMGKQSFEFETITVCFCTAMNQGNQNHVRRGVLVKPE